MIALHQLAVRHPRHTGIIGHHAKRFALGARAGYSRFAAFAGALERYHRHAYRCHDPGLRFAPGRSSFALASGLSLLCSLDASNDCARRKATVTAPKVEGGSTATRWTWTMGD